jgi:hypothetical protein
MKKLVSLASLSLIGSIACAIAAADTPNDPQDANEFRCVSSNDDGSCTSMPASCPVIGPVHPTNPRCPAGWSIIPAAQDNCAHKMICID